MLVEQGLRSRDQIIYDLRLTPSDVEELGLLSVGFFSGLEFVAGPRVRDFDDSTSRRVGNGGVLLFPGKPEN